LAGGIIEAARGFSRHAEDYQRLTYWVGAALIAIGLLHLAAFLLFGGPWVGAVAWRKPFAFGLSFGVTAITLAWFATYLPMSRRTGWLLYLPLSLACVSEVLWVTLQRARGVHSHFNVDTPFDEFLFGLNGVAVAVIVAVIVVLTVWSFTRPRGTPAMAWAMRGGLVALNLSMIAGVLMIAQGVAQAEPGFVPKMTFGEAGIMKIPHAVGMHGIQVLPAIALLLAAAVIPEDTRTRAMQLAVAGYLGLVLVSVLQTFSGLAPWDLTALTGLVLVASLVLLVSWVPALFRNRDPATSRS
jgi:hypothetical protein